MASRYRTISRPAINLLKSAAAKSSTRPSVPLQSARIAPPLPSRPMPQISALMSLLPPPHRGLLCKVNCVPWSGLLQLVVSVYALHFQSWPLMDFMVFFLQLGKIQSFQARQ